MKIATHPDKAVKEKLRALLIIKRDRGEELYKIAYRRAVLQDFWFFIRVTLGWSFPCENFHARTVLKFIEKNEGHDIALFLPRGHVKTLLIGVALNTWKFIREYAEGDDVEEVLARLGLGKRMLSIMVASATEDHARNMCKTIAGMFTGHPVIREMFPECCPRSGYTSQSWNNTSGYDFPNALPKIDPCFFPAGIKSNVTGKHPNEVHLDDLIVPQNATDKGYEEAEAFLGTVQALLTQNDSRIRLVGTRYGERDTYQKIIEGEILGVQGEFKVLTSTCWRNPGDAEALLKPVYAPRRRLNFLTGMKEESVSGFTRKALLTKKVSMKSFFNAQFLNDPTPSEDRILCSEDYKVVSEADIPKFTHVNSFGVESIGQGKVIFNLFQAEVEDLRLNVPLEEIKYPLNSRQGGSDKYSSKEMRIINSLVKPLSEGRIYIMDWMAEEEEGLLYETDKLGGAKRDDLVDTLHMLIECQCGAPPPKGGPADLHIAADIALNPDTNKDRSVVMCVAHDSSNNFWVLDYDAFHIENPKEIISRFIRFFQKWEHDPRQKSKIGRQATAWAASYK